MKELFTVPEGKPVTEKLLCRVLISSVCSILLCMACLVSTTWAWYIVGIENPDNVIRIATIAPEVRVIHENEEGISLMEEDLDEEAYTDGYELEPGIYTIAVGLDSNADNLSAPAYVVMQMTWSDETGAYMEEMCGFAFEDRRDSSELYVVVHSGAAEIRFSASWAEPEDVDILSGDHEIVVGEPPEELPEDEQDPEEEAPEDGEADPALDDAEEMDADMQTDPGGAEPDLPEEDGTDEPDQE